MANAIFNLLSAKGLKVTEEESILLQSQWDYIQSLKRDFDDICKNEDDMILCHIPEGSTVNE